MVKRQSQAYSPAMSAKPGTPAGPNVHRDPAWASSPAKEIGGVFKNPVINGDSRTANSKETRKEKQPCLRSPVPRMQGGG
ncbi:MAG: hypothetical protein J0H74_19500 [Chitinophagaceae bacterium]|nr:hypothetical protein [Chitinophagaceae bacterium]